MNLTMKNIQKSMLQLEIHYFPILSLIIFLGIGSICSGNINSLYAQTENSNGEQSKSRIDKDLSITTIKVKMDKNNLDIAKHDRIKVVGYLNGEGQTKYINLKNIDEEELSSILNPNSLTVNLQFNKSNDISSTMVDDEY